MTPLHIGLVNNMPGPALKATERQFVTLLNESAGADFTVHVSFYALPGIPRTGLALGHLSSYRSIDDLRIGSHDALIVTGAEPRSANLADEPFWGEMARLVDWAAQNTTSTVWSC